MTFATSSPNQLIPLPNRGLLQLSGADKAGFLQGLITNDTARVSKDNGLYACLLTAQGKFLHDFFIVEDGANWLIDCEYDRRQDLMKRLLMYKLRKQIDMVDLSEDYQIYASFENQETDCVACPDPRHKDMGRRIFQNRKENEQKKKVPTSDFTRFSLYESRRINLRIPDGSRDMQIEKDLVMDYSLDKLNGVDFNKGCYLGQERTSRMFFRDLIKRQLCRVRIEGEIPPPQMSLTQNDKEIGVMKTSSGDQGLALLKTDFVNSNESRPIQYDNFMLHLV